MKPIAEVTATTGRRNRRSGRIGSAARCSAARNRAAKTTAVRASTRTGGEVHAYTVPPHVVTSTRQPTAIVSRTAPR